MVHRSWFPSSLEGDLVVLRRHEPENLDAFRRWYSDAEVARLARYQDGPMRVEEIDRFFQARALGNESLAMAIHIRDSGRLIGSCAFSQMDPDNGSAMFHITIGEKREWGHGYGTEATRLMLEHAFNSLGLHRVALAVFEFNERAVRAYKRNGLKIEGRAREAIWRDGRWWDELSMSILQSEWRTMHPGRRRTAVETSPAGVGSAAGAAAGTPSARQRVAARLLGR